MKRDIFLLKNKLKYAIILAGIITAFLIFACFKLSVFWCFTPVSYSSNADINNLYKSGTRFVKCYTNKLYYTGYDYIEFNDIKAHYYYSLNDSRCTIYMLSADLVNDYIASNKLENETPYTIENFTFKASLKDNPANLKPLLKYISNDLDWNYEGITKYSNTVIVSEYNYNPLVYMSIIVVTGTFFIITIIITFIYLKK